MKKNLPPHFCVIPFIHFSTKPSGQARICCFSQNSYVKNEHGETYRLGQDTISEIWHSQWMNDFRQKMLGTEPLPECGFCYKEEAVGKKSKRLIESDRYLNEIEPLLEEFQSTGSLSQGPRYFDLRLGNLCNLKCRTCNPLFSSAWEQEIEKNLASGEVEMYRSLYLEAQKNKNWYQSEKFWQQIAEVGEFISEVYITGGEPMIIEEHFILLQKLIEKGFASDVVLRYNTNLTKLPDRLKEYLPHFKKVILSCSIDGLDERNEWLRPPSRWQRLMENLSKASELPQNVVIEINCTISLFNILTYREFVTYFKMLSKSLKRPFEVSADILHEPSFMTIQVLPKNLRQAAQKNLRELLEDTGISLNSHERREVESLIKLLEFESPQAGSALQELKSHTETFDRLRSQSFYKTFPELHSLFEPK